MSEARSQSIPATVSGSASPCGRSWVRGKVLGSEGDYTWSGIFNTVFWVDPREELILVFLTNFSPYELQRRWYVKTLVY